MRSFMAPCTGLRRGAAMLAVLAGLPFLVPGSGGQTNVPVVYPSRPNVIGFGVREARFVRLMIHRTEGGAPCFDEVEIYGPESDANLALATIGAKATASSCIAGYAIHAVQNLNDGAYGNSHSWIAAGADDGQWVQIELPRPASVDRVVFSRDRSGRFTDRVPLDVAVLTSLDGRNWESAARLQGRQAGSASGPGVRQIAFRQEHARYVRLTILGTNDGKPPSLDEIQVFGAEPDANLAERASGATVSASSAGDSAARLNDGLSGTHWTAAGVCDQWVQVDLGRRVEVNRMTFARDLAFGPTDGTPTVFSVDISMNGVRWKKLAREGWGFVPSPPPLAAARSMPPVTTDRAPATNARGFANLALADGATARASSVIPGLPEIHAVAHLNDGRYGNAHSWVSASDPSWAEIDLGGARWVCAVALGSDSLGRFVDRAATTLRVLAADDTAKAAAPAWKTVAERVDHPGFGLREEITFRPIRASRIRVEIESARGGACRIDELEVYGRAAPISITEIGTFEEWPTGVRSARNAAIEQAFVAEEHAWLKTYGRADLDPGLTEYVRVWQYPDRRPEDVLPLPELHEAPDLAPATDDACWKLASWGTARVASPAAPRVSPLVEQRVGAATSGKMLYLRMTANRMLSSHLMVISATDWSGCGVLVMREAGLAFDQYRPTSDGGLTRVASMPIQGGADPLTGVCEAALPLDLFPGCLQRGLRVGLGLGGRQTSPLGRSVEFRPAGFAVAEEAGDEAGSFGVRLLASAQARPIVLSGEGLPNGEVRLQPGRTHVVRVPAPPGPIGPERTLVLRDGDGRQWRLGLFRYDPMHRVLALMQDMANRLAAQGVDVGSERAQVQAMRTQHARTPRTSPEYRPMLMRARMAKRTLMLRAPELAALQRVLYVRRHAYEPSHNYSDLLDATGGMGGSVDIARIPRTGGRLQPEHATIDRLFESGQGIARDAVAAPDLSRVHFAYKPSAGGYFHLMEVRPDGKGLRRTTDGPFHDLYPTPLPDGALAFISTRCRARYLCWRPQAYVLFRRDAGGIKPLSHANLSEWAPSITSDGRILWTRSEYQDKGADFSHTLWTIQPDGSKADLAFGNTIIQPNGYANGHEVPGTHELVCTLISHFGDLNGPLALIDLTRGKFDPLAIRSLTPEVPWPGLWPAEECFRDPIPISRDYFLCSHAPQRRFGAWIVDRFGNREQLLTDPTFSIMCPTPFVRRELGPRITEIADKRDTAEIVVTDVYRGLEGYVPRGQARWLRISQEVRAELDRVAGGYRSDHPEFLDWYATPIHLVNGPYGWPSFVAKASWGLVPIGADGSARFRAPANKTLYFSVLDSDFNELQRMRSVVQFSAGEKRSCVGCHESRTSAPPNVRRPAYGRLAAVRRSAWDGRPFSFERDVQPVLDRKCASCHTPNSPTGVDLSGVPDAERIPPSYRTLISRGLVHHFDWSWNPGGNEKAEPRSFGSLKSRLFTVLRDHHGVQLSSEENLRLKTWIDLNCPLWPDYTYRPDRSARRH